MAGLAEWYVDLINQRQREAAEARTLATIRGQQQARRSGAPTSMYLQDSLEPSAQDMDFYRERNPAWVERPEVKIPMDLAFLLGAKNPARVAQAGRGLMGMVRRLSQANNMGSAAEKIGNRPEIQAARQAYGSKRANQNARKTAAKAKQGRSK